MILENPAVNAWSLPGGQIVVCTGLLQFVRTYLHDSDDVLAFFIGHEVAHLVNRDMERSQEGIQVIKAAFAGGNPPLMTFQHGLSRAAELRADTDGVLFAYRAKFNPATAIQWCEAMIATYGDTDPNGDHPTFKARKERLKWFLTGEIQVAYGKFRVGVDAFHKGDYAVAAENFSGYLNRFPYDKYAINNLGVVYHQQAIRKAGGAPHGEWRLTMGVEVKPDLPPLHIRGNPPEGTLDEVLLRKAIQQFETALRIDRRYKVAYKNLGDVYGDLGEFDRANEAYKQALNIDSQYAEAQNSLGVLLCRQKQFEDGIHLFQEVLRLAKDNLEARYNLALAYEYASQPEKARDAWQAYLIFDGKSDWADRARGHLGE
jgi:tetratricopeptide (TPR) repeat protein